MREYSAFDKQKFTLFFFLFLYNQWLTTDVQDIDFLNEKCEFT